MGTNISVGQFDLFELSILITLGNIGEPDNDVEDDRFDDKATEEVEMLVEVVLAADDVVEDVVEVVEEDDLLDVDCVSV